MFYQDQHLSPILYTISPSQSLQQQLSLIQNSSSDPQQQQPQTLQENCQICYIKYLKLKSEHLRPAHICYNCWYQHIKTNVTKISYMVGANLISPFQYQEEIDICMALNGLNQKDKDQIQELLYKKYTTFTKDIEKCPSQTCDFVFTTEKCKWTTGTSHLCPKCDTQLSVSQNVTLKSVLGFIYFIFMANKCPKCDIPIERISGCPHMTCPCGHQFCWFCLKDHAFKPPNLYTVHEPKQCASIFISKIIILLTCMMSLSCFLVGGETLRHLMQMAFDFSAYVIQAVVLDLWVVAHLVVNSMYRDQPYRNFPLQRSSKKVKILASALINLVFIGILFVLDILTVSLAIVFVELTIIGLGALIIYGVIYSSETWFEFIN